MTRACRVGSAETRLVVIRGNSGSGKSALAEALGACRPKGTLALVGQDVLRRDVLGVSGDDGDHAPGLLDLTARYALARGFDVIVEGILHPTVYREILCRLADDHQGMTRGYLYDVSFEETLRRHSTKPAVDEFGEAEMRAWWRGLEPIDGLDESLIGERDSLETTVLRVLSEGWPK